jgi:hypothetical protein
MQRGDRELETCLTGNSRQRRIRTAQKKTKLGQHGNETETNQTEPCRSTFGQQLEQDRNPEVPDTGKEHETKTNSDQTKDQAEMKIAQHRQDSKHDFFH